MDGTTKRPVNAEDMLAELKRVVEASTHAPGARQHPAASMAGKSSLPKPEIGRSQIDRSGPAAQARAGKATAPRTEARKPAARGVLRWTLSAAGLALAGAAVAWAGVAFMNQAPSLPGREVPAAAAQGLAGSQDEPILKSSDNGSATARGGAEIAPRPAASDLASGQAPFTSAPPDLGAVPVASQIIGPDGAPIGQPPSTPALTDKEPPLAQRLKLEAPSLATAPSTPAPIQPATLAEQPKPEAAPAAAPQAVRPDEPSLATAPPAAASTEPAARAETPKPVARPKASVAEDSVEPSEPKTDLKKKAQERPSAQKPRRNAKASAKSVAPPERRSTEPATPKGAETSPEPVESAGNPPAVAPVKAPSVPQQLANGVTHAFGYLVHLPGALVPRLGGANANAE